MKINKTTVNTIKKAFENEMKMAKLTKEEKQVKLESLLTKYEELVIENEGTHTALTMQHHVIAIEALIAKYGK